MTPGPRPYAFVFPGQASQRAGMAAALLDQEPAARSVFQVAGEVIGLDLGALCTEGSDALLTRTDVAQPALLTTCVAWLTVLQSRGLSPRLLAGHSLGEFSAWVAAGVLDLPQAVRLVRRRGELMEEAAQRRPGGMVAVLGLSDEQVAGVCRRAAEAGVVVPANYNSPGQVVISGEEKALERALEEVRRLRGRAIPLRVSGAFHSPLMEDAARAFARLVAEAPLNRPRIPVVANASAELVTNVGGARAAMSRQMSSPVLWSASVARMLAEGVEVFIEVGPGQVLTNLIGRISPQARALPAGAPEDLPIILEEVLG